MLDDCFKKDRSLFLVHPTFQCQLAEKNPTLGVADLTDSQGNRLHIFQPVQSECAESEETAG